MQSFASQFKQNNFPSIAMHELFFPTVFICLFVWQEVFKRYLKISRNRAITRKRLKSCKEKTQPRDRKKRNRKHFMATKCNKMNNKKRKNWDFYEIRVENKRCNFPQRLNKYFQEQLCTFLERNEYSPYNINQRYVLTYVFTSNATRM